VSQLAENYGETAADSLLSGLTQEVFLRAGDERTLDYYTSRLGVNPNVETEAHSEAESAHPTTDPAVLWNQLQRLDDGEGYVLKQGGYAHVSVPMLSQLSCDTRAAVRDRAVDHTL
jgi:type IV secretory pathway TraG/TraD family ATPase VirD4